MEHVESHPPVYLQHDNTSWVHHSVRCRIPDLQDAARACGVPWWFPITGSSGHIIVRTGHVSDGRASNASYAGMLMAGQNRGRDKMTRVW